MTDRVTIADKIDPIAIQAKIAEETAKSNAVQQAEKRADLYHTELAIEEQLKGDANGPTNVQRLAAIMARNLII